MKKVLICLIVIFLFQSLPAQWGRLWYAPDWNLYAVYFLNNNIGLVGAYQRIYRTTNGGHTWDDVGLYAWAQQFHSISFVNNQHGLIVGGSNTWESGVILKTSNGGLNWFTQHTGLNSEILYDVDYIDLLHAVAVGNAGRILTTTDGGQNWVYQNSGVTGNLSGVAFINPDVGFIVYGSGMLKTTDGGTSWSVIPGMPALREIYFVNENVGFAVGNKILHTSDGGSTWDTQLTVNYLNAVHFSDTSCGTAVGWDGWQGIVFRTTDGGNNWIDQNVEADRQLLDVYFPSRDTGYISGVDGFMLFTSNGGVPVELTSFEALPEGNNVNLSWSTATELNNRGFEIERKNNNSWRTLAFISGHGTTSERHRYNYSDNLSDLDGVSSVWYRLKQVDYDGSFEYSKEIEVTFAAEYSLEQNYPNPFNPLTTINYSLPVRGKVWLIVYDALGREVKKLVDEEKEAGKYEIEFNADGLASGMYFYQLRANDVFITRKMMVMK